MDEHEGLLVAAITTLRELPAVRPDATARVLVAIAAERQRDRERDASGASRKWMWTGIAAAVVLGILVMPVARRFERDPAMAPARGAPIVPQVLTSTNAASVTEMPRPVQLVFSAPSARSVRVVGDFNGWDERRSPMMRDGASGLWNVHLMLRPGRHVYAYVVNDSQWVRDPRAAAAPDADFGNPGSVMLVGHP